MPTLEERFESLEASNRLLSNDVQKLIGAIQIIRDIEAKQRETDRKAEVAKSEVRRIEAESRARERRTRNAFGAIGLIAAVVLPAVSILVYWALITHVNDLLNKGAQDRLSACLLRNEGVQLGINRERALSELAGPKTEEGLVHSTSATDMSKTLIDCQGLYGEAARRATR